MPPQRKVDLVLDSVKRLLRVGATANLSNLLQKQHPADLAQIFGELPDRDRIAAFSVLVERNSRLAMETLSELGPRNRRPAARRPIGRRNRQARPGAAVRRCGGPDRQPARRAVDGRPRVDGPEGVGRGREPARVSRTDGGPHHEPACLRACRGHDGRRGHHGPAELARRRDGVLSLHRRCARASGRGDVAAPVAARLARDAAQADHDGRSDQRPRRHGPGGGRAAGRVLQPAGDSRRRRSTTSSSASSRSTTSSTSSRTRRPKTCIALPACRATSASLRPPASRCASACHGSSSIWRRPFWPRRSSACFSRRSHGWVALAVFMPIVAGMGGNAATQTLTVIIRGIALGELTWSNSRKALAQEPAGRRRQRRGRGHDCRARRLGDERRLPAGHHPGAGAWSSICSWRASWAR